MNALVLEGISSVNPLATGPAAVIGGSPKTHHGQEAHRQGRDKKGVETQLRHATPRRNSWGGFGAGHGGSGAVRLRIGGYASLTKRERQATEEKRRTRKKKTPLAVEGTDSQPSRVGR